MKLEIKLVNQFSNLLLLEWDCDPILSFEDWCSILILRDHFIVRGTYYAVGQGAYAIQTITELKET